MGSPLGRGVRVLSVWTVMVFLGAWPLAAADGSLADIDRLSQEIDQSLSRLKGGERKPVKDGAHGPLKCAPSGALIPEYTPLAVYKRLANLKLGSSATGECRSLPAT